jgi:hypothetical protein
VAVMVDERLRGDERQQGRPGLLGHTSMLERRCFAKRPT